MFITVFFNQQISENQFRNFKYVWDYRVKLRIKDIFNLSIQIFRVYIFENLRQILEIKYTLKILFSEISIFWLTRKTSMKMFFA